MKTLLLVMAVLVAASSYSQIRTVNKKTFKVSVVDESNVKHDGYLVTVSDSNLSMVKSPIIFEEGLILRDSKNYAYENISKITYSRKGAVGRGIIIGALSGAVIGTIVGAVSYEKPAPCDTQNPFCLNLDFGAGVSAAGGAALGTLGGGLIGGIIGAVAKKTFIIGGKRESFKKFQISVLDKAYGETRVQTIQN